MRVRYTIFGLFASFAVIFFAGCPEAISPPETPKTGPNVLVVYIAGDSPAGRTALPSGIQAPATYAITVSRGLTILGSAAGLMGPGPFDVLLSSAPVAGDEVAVKGFDGGGSVEIAEGTGTLPSGYAGAPITIPLTLLGLQAGTGNVALTVSFPAFSGDDEITAAQLRLYRSLADYQAGNGYDSTRYRKNTGGGDYGVGENLGTSIPINYSNIPSGNYVVEIEFFRLKYIRVARLVQTIIVRDTFTTDRWDNGGSTLTLGEDKFASSDANLTGITLGGDSVPGFSPAVYAYAISEAVTAAPGTKTLRMTGTPGQAIAVWLNGVYAGSGRSVSLPMKAVNSIVIIVTAPDGITKQTYTVSYTYYNQTEWYVTEGGSDGNNGTNDTDDAMATVSAALVKVKSSYSITSPPELVWPGKNSDPSDPLAARITITGTLSENAVTISESNLPPILLTGTGTITSGDTSDKRPLTIENGVTVIMEGGLTLTGGKHSEGGGGVHLTGGSKFIMNGGTITGNTSTAGGSSGRGGGGVQVTNGSAFTMNGGTIGGSSLVNTSDNDGGGVFVTNGSTFTMNGGTICGNTTAFGGGGVATVSGGTFIMKGGNLDGNFATHGGGVILFNGGNTFKMEGGNIIRNTATDYLGYYGGGGVLLVGDSFTMSGGTISENTVAGSGSNVGGGGVANHSGTFTMEGGTISGNTLSGKYGGGVYLSSTGTGNFNMSGGTIGGNKAGYGGGVYIAGGSFTMSGESGVSGNNAGSSSSAGYGGGVYIADGSFTMSEESGVSGNNAAASGLSSGYGGGVYIADGSFSMSGGTINGNNAANGSLSLSRGGGVYVDDGIFSMSGSAAVDTGNAVYLFSNKVIILSGALTANPAANIESAGNTGDSVLAGDIAEDDNYKKFWLNGASNAAGNKISVFGTIQ
jgi:hypothetical protein